jgi:quercetin dioxygenase-like cupin family protein
MTAKPIQGPTYFLVDEVEWVDERRLGTAPLELVEEAERLGARRKLLASGEGGFYSQYSVMPAGYVVPPHSHDHDELFVVLEGSCTLEGNERPLRAHDSIVLRAGAPYGFTCGREGMTFLVVRSGDAGTTLAR